MYSGAGCQLFFIIEESLAPPILLFHLTDGILYNISDMLLRKESKRRQIINENRSTL